MKKVLVIGMMIWDMTCTSYALDLAIIAAHPILGGYAETVVEAKSEVTVARKKMSYAFSDQTRLRSLLDFAKAQTIYTSSLRRLNDVMAHLAGPKGVNNAEAQAKLKELETAVAITAGIDLSVSMVRAEIGRLLSDRSKIILLRTLITLSNEESSKLEETAGEYMALCQ